VKRGRSADDLNLNRTPKSVKKAAKRSTSRTSTYKNRKSTLSFKQLQNTFKLKPGDTNKDLLLLKEGLDNIQSPSSSLSSKMNQNDENQPQDIEDRSKLLQYSSPNTYEYYTQCLKNPVGMNDVSSGIYVQLEPFTTNKFYNSQNIDRSSPNITMQMNDNLSKTFTEHLNQASTENSQESKENDSFNEPLQIETNDELQSSLDKIAEIVANSQGSMFDNNNQKDTNHSHPMSDQDQEFDELPNDLVQCEVTISTSENQDDSEHSLNTTFAKDLSLISNVVETNGTKNQKKSNVNIDGYQLILERIDERNPYYRSYLERTKRQGRKMTEQQDQNSSVSNKSMDLSLVTKSPNKTKKTQKKTKQKKVENDEESEAYYHRNDFVFCCWPSDGYFYPARVLRRTKNGGFLCQYIDEEIDTHYRCNVDEIVSVDKLRVGEILEVLNSQKNYQKSSLLKIEILNENVKDCQNDEVIFICEVTTRCKKRKADIKR
jgi:hypothetical protein